MRIAYVADSQIPSRTANSVHVMRMCQAYADLGHEVTLVVPDWRGGLEEGVDDVFAFYGVRSSFTIRRVPRLGGRLDLLVHGLVLPLGARRLRPDLVHTRSLAAAWGLTRLLSLRTILEAHRPLGRGPRLRSMFRSVVSAPRFAGLVVITHALAERLAPELPDQARPLVAPDGVDRRWLESPLTRNEARARLGLDPRTGPLAVYTGHLYRGRGIELIADLAAKRPEYRFLIVGGRRAEVDAFRRRDHPHNLELVGFRPPADVFLYLRAADVLLMPYADRLETTGGTDTAAYASPMKLFEYLAAGRPILASTLPVLGEILDDGHNALLLPYDAPERWSEALGRLRSEPETAEQLGRQAASDARRYTWEARAERILDRFGPSPDRSDRSDRHEERVP